MQNTFYKAEESFSARTNFLWGLWCDQIKEHFKNVFFSHLKSQTHPGTREGLKELPAGSSSD